MSEEFYCDPCDVPAWEEPAADPYQSEPTDVQAVPAEGYYVPGTDWYVGMPTVTENGIQLAIDPLTGEVSAGTFGVDILNDLRNGPASAPSTSTPVFDPGVNMGEIGTRLDLPTLNTAGDYPGVDPVYDPSTATTLPQRDGQLTPNT